MEEIHNLQDLASFLENFLEDTTVWCRLEWNGHQSPQSIVLSQFEGKFDFCDVSTDESDRGIALEFVFHPTEAAEEPQIVSLPVDPDDIEVNILDEALEIESLDFYILLRITNRSLG
jgi:hypothetical protein